MFITDVFFQPLLNDFLESCSVNHVAVFLIDPIVLKSIEKGKASHTENEDCHYLCQKSLITLGVLEFSLSLHGLNAHVCSFSVPLCYISF